MDGRDDPTSRHAIALLSNYAEQTFVTQTELARRSGITQSQISRLFRFRATLSLAHVLGICRALSLDPLAVIAEAQSLAEGPRHERDGDSDTAG